MTGIDYDWLLPSDHYSIHSTTTKPRYERVVHNPRKICHIDINVSASVIQSVLPVMDPLGSGVPRLVKEYNIKTKAVIDKIAPLVTKSYLVKPCTSWFNASHLQKRRHVSWSEKKS